MFVDFKYFANLGVLTLLFTLFLMFCGLKGVGTMFMAILFMTGLAVYFGSKEG
jgi:NhaP-type Na+/H+ or K+/H+ antiporter